MNRSFDVVVGAIGLIVSLPLWPLIAIATKLQGPGPVFYEQERWGRGGTTFVVKKFRTMSTTRDAPIEQSVPDDPRVTKVGRVLRASGLDELPQLIAIIKGDMSLVGPRPLAVGELVRDAAGQLIPYEQVPGFAERLAVRPGLTGPSTIYLPKDASPSEKFARDIRYVHERSFLGDVRLVFISIAISLRGRWESRGPKV